MAAVGEVKVVKNNMMYHCCNLTLLKINDLDFVM